MFLLPLLIPILRIPTANNLAMILWLLLLLLAAIFLARVYLEDAV